MPIDHCLCYLLIGDSLISGRSFCDWLVDRVNAGVKATIVVCLAVQGVPKK